MCRHAHSLFNEHIIIIETVFQLNCTKVALTVAAAVLLVFTRPAAALDNQVDSPPPPLTKLDPAALPAGSCRASGLCCQSKNNTCRGGVAMAIQSTAADVDEDLEAKKQQLAARCFCDSACLDIGDCCDDYEQACQRKCSAVGGNTHWLYENLYYAPPLIAWLVAPGGP